MIQYLQSLRERHAWFKRLAQMMAQNKINITRMSGYISMGQFSVVIATWFAVSTAMSQWWVVFPVGALVVAVILAAGRTEIEVGVLEEEQEVYFNHVPQIRKIMAQLDRIEERLAEYDRDRQKDKDQA